MARLLTIVILSLCSISNAAIYITVTGANVKKAKLALGKIHPLPDSTEASPDIAKRLRDEVKSDLEFANLFDFVPDSAVAPLDNEDLYSMKYDAWAATGASFALRMGYRLQGGKVFLEALFYDIPGQKKIFGTRFHYLSSQPYRVVHALTEDILKELTGERGLFLSRVVMTCRDLSRKKSPPKDIYVVDADGRNPIALTNDNTLSLSPSWAGDGKNITYTQYDWVGSGRARKRGTVLKKHNLQTGDRRILSARDGMNSGAAWSPSASKIAATLSFSGRPEIYLLNPNATGDAEPLSRGIQWRRLTGEGFQPSNVNQLFDVEPSWSPDEKKIVFSSARTGHPMIYIVDLATRQATQLTFAGQYNASPAWSPKGDKILFAAQRTGEGNFDIYMIDPDGNNLSRITTGEFAGRRKFNNENPSWAPTGRHFVYGSNEGGVYAIYASTIDGTVKRKISPEGKECTTPAWSPYIGPTS